MKAIFYVHAFNVYEGFTLTMTPLRALRERACVKVVVAAYQLNTTRKTFWEWETGRRVMPANRIQAMATLFQVPFQTVVWAWLEMQGVKHDGT